MKKAAIFILLISGALTSFSINQESKKSTQSESLTTSSMFDMPRNAVYNEDIIAFFYERLFPVSKQVGIALKGGFVIWDPLMPAAEMAVVLGRTKHFVEAGVGTIPNFDNDEGYDFITIRAGYRYQAPKGFLFKASALYSPDNFILPLIGVGYAF